MAKLPETIGKYQVLREIGRGGMGKVYEVRDPGVPDRPLALKLILPHLAEGAALQRFGREAQLLGRVSHPNVLRVVDLGRAPEGPFLVTDLVEGESLHKVAAARSLAPRAAAAVVRDLARAVEAIHQVGVLHRDLKPENVILRPDGTPILLDFGLARADDVDRLTRTGVVMGTPNYMAPEQADGMSPTEMDGRVDVYGLGGILFTLLSSELPVQGQTRLGVIQKVIAGQLDWPAGCDTGPEAGLWAICRQALAADREQRFQSAEALARALDTWLRGGRRAGARRRGVPKAAIAGAALLLLGGGGFAAARLAGRGGGGGGESARCELTLLEPAKDGETLELSVLVKGRVDTNVPDLKLKVGDRAARPLPADGAFEQQADLSEGENRLRIVVSDGQGKVWAELTRLIVRHSAPPWVRELPAERRPPVPLPQGLVFQGPGEYRNEKEGSVLVWVPPGTFTMGSDEAPAMGEMNERPAHQVTLTRGFFIGRYEVTWEQYERFCQETKTKLPPNPNRVGPKHPVSSVSSQGAYEYCRWAGLRLPSETEWEYAARGPDGRTFPWGEEEGERFAAVAVETTRPVGSYPDGRSPFGCLDMIGNVAEYALMRADRFGPATDPPARQNQLLLKSGGYSATSLRLWARASIRWGTGIEPRSDHGFRVARSAD